MNARFSRRYSLVLAVLSLIGATIVAPASVRADTVFESYETDFGGWTPNADTPLPWSVTRSQVQAHDGAWSLEFFTDGRADDGTVWVVRTVDVGAGTWDVGLDFHMWSPNAALFGTWEVVAFIGTFEPAVEADFTIVGNTHMNDGWHKYSHGQTITVGGPTTIYLAYGLNIVFEVQHILYFDSVTVSGIPLTCDDPACDSDGVCESGEDCMNCPCDCQAVSAAICGNGICETSDDEDCLSCPSDCNGKQSGNPSSRFCCGDGDGLNPVTCSDPECSGGGFSCTNSPVGYSCCGDSVCEGNEDTTSCTVDCSLTCTSPADCDDGIGCTDDDCVGGACVNTANDANCPDDGLFCNGAEVCDAALDCVSSGDPCGSGTTCNETTDTCDPSACGEKGDPCTLDEDCCSLNCKPNGTCR